MPKYTRKVPDSIRVNLLDEKFGRLTVIGFGGRKKGQTMWVCRCACGQVREYHAGNLRAGRSTQCVRCQIDALQQTSKNFEHGYSQTTTYRAWTGARRYGRCKRWDKFENFLADMGERPAGARLVRLNRGKPFSPSNAVWRTARQTLGIDVELTLKVLVEAGKLKKSEIAGRRKKLRAMSRQARCQLRRAAGLGKRRKPRKKK